MIFLLTFLFFLLRFWRDLAICGRKIDDFQRNPTMAMSVKLNFISALTFLFFLPGFRKHLAVCGGKIIDCQSNPTIAVNVSLNFCLRLNISIFLAENFKRLGSAWQKCYWLSKESNHSSKCKFKSLSPHWHFYINCQYFEETGQCVADLLKIVKGIQA